MKRFTLAACAALLAAATAAPALAADLSRPAFKAAPAYAAPFNWTGFYVGINGGYGWGKSNWTNRSPAPPPATSISAARWSAARPATICRSASWSSAPKATSTPAGSRAPTPPAAARPKTTGLRPRARRLGFALDRWMPFVTGGAAFGDIKMTRSARRKPRPRSAGPPAPASNTPSWAPGRPRSNISMPISARRRATRPPAAPPMTSRFKTNIVRAGVNYHF